MLLSSPCLTAVTDVISIEVSHSGELFPHIVRTFLRIQNPQVRPITHEHKVHLDVDGNLYAEQAMVQRRYRFLKQLSMVLYLIKAFLLEGIGLIH